MKMHQATYNRFKYKLLKKMKESIECSGLGTRSRRQHVEFYNTYENQCNYKETIQQSLARVHCKPVHDGVGQADNLFKLNCAFGRCENCPKFKIPEAEIQ